MNHPLDLKEGLSHFFANCSCLKEYISTSGTLAFLPKCIVKWKYSGCLLILVFAFKTSRKVMNTLLDFIIEEMLS